MNSSEGIISIFDRYNLLDIINNKFFVDIGAADGISQSNSHWLSTQNKFDGICVEYDKNRYNKLCGNQPNTININAQATPDTINNILSDNNCPREFGFLSVDIDTYDYYLLDTILKEYKPDIICCEINEKIPPPIKFMVDFIDENQYWKNDHFFGCSIQSLEDFKKYGYNIICLDYNNVFLSNNKDIPYVSIEHAYDDGYKNKEDRKTRYFWNRDCESWLWDSPSSVIQQIDKKFEQYQNMYYINVTKELI